VTSCVILVVGGLAGLGKTRIASQSSQLRAWGRDMGVPGHF
jgi:hypothetical protein